MWRELIQRLEPMATFFLAATPTQITEVEAALGIAIPEDLKRLLAESNGVFGSYGLRLIWSAETIEVCNREMRNAAHYREMYMPFDAYLFFADAGNGDQFAFGIIQGEIRQPDIFVWNHEDDSRAWVLPSLESYIEWWLTGKLHI
jgi:hypothetical protein